jgi:hypothetical protein
MEQSDGSIESTPSATPVRVIYIMGAARSGSTVLAALLGSHPDVFCAGELSYLPGNGWRGAEYCSCGQPGNVCPFWNDARSKWHRLTAGGNLQCYERLIQRTELSGQSWRDLSKRHDRDDPVWRPYARHTWAVFEAIRQASGKTTVVDSSKRRTRALALAMIPGIDLRVIHLVRDVRGVAWSMQKRLERDDSRGVPEQRPGRHAWRTTAGWIQNHFECQRVLGRLVPGRFVRLRYEDIVTDPAGALAALAPVLGVDVTETARQLGAGEPIRMEHVIAGNRLRMAGRLRLKPDVEWQNALGPLDRWVCWAMAGWLLRRYGYRRRPRWADRSAGKFRRAA